MTPADTFTVDVDQLNDTVDRIAASGAILHDLADRLSARIAALHLTWAGAAAEAQLAAQAEWEAGFADMREALGRIRAAALAAHANYTSAADANLRMWEQVD